MSAFVEIRSLSKQYSAGVGIDKVSVEVRRGELLAVLGPSGCGKSTLLRLIGGYEKASSGSISLDGADVTALEPERRNIGMGFQNYALFPHLNVIENVEVGLKMRGAAGPARRPKAHEALALVDLEGMDQRRP